MGESAHSLERTVEGEPAPPFLRPAIPVQPPAPPAGTTSDPTNPGGQLPGTYPTLQTKLEAQLPKFMAAADAYPKSQPGQLARLRAAETLAQLGRRDEAITQYDQLTGSSSEMIARAARLGKTSVQIQAGQFDAAIATLKERVSPGEMQRRMSAAGY